MKLNEDRLAQIIRQTLLQSLPGHVEGSDALQADVGPEDVDNIIIPNVTAAVARYFEAITTPTTTRPTVTRKDGKPPVVFTSTTLALAAICPHEQVEDLYRSFADTARSLLSFPGVTEIIAKVVITSTDECGDGEFRVDFFARPASHTDVVAGLNDQIVVTP